MRERFDLKDTVVGRRRYVDLLVHRAVEEETEQCGIPATPEEVDGRCSHLRRGWYWGSQKFALKLDELAGKLINKRKRTTVSQEWIATRLAMRSAANVSQHLRRFERSDEQDVLPKKLQEFLRKVWEA